ncbi:DUF11 domain-containing protein [Maribacter sp. BPC-D8]|uniref:DUF11 domain-containing protein n=1 Tax=Maribacter sp. BPC-D8 TaxID=3053613 RepID=UPI002B45AAF8|nr:DUF11 domain-containing protein [Maribacter sp. BPC-D8]WRI27685.1 DUF11 domain-containing protein [Maribacter sp. BPC-D8]
MKQKLILFIVFMMVSAAGFSQLSDLHYLPPLKQGGNNQAVTQQSLYLSTPETTAFTVNIYQGTSTTLYATASLSKTTPQEITLGNGDNNITMMSNANTGIVLTSGGLRLESPGGEKFYVNYRGRSGSQATSLTSKGRQAIGTHFKWGGAPNKGTQASLTNSLGIMATADGTTVTLSGYDPDCEFRLGADRDGILADTYTINLDANESFVFEAYVAETPANADGWLGADVISNNPIVISNGGLNTGARVGYAGRDAAIDQPVPQNKIGKEYVFIRGNGTSETEIPIIIGTQNGTAIYVNGSGTPIATINNGDYFEIPESNYSVSSAGGNMYVTTSKDAYAYQLMAGASAIYTQGLNFIAPVNCLLPDTVDNITHIEDAAGVTMTGGVTLIASTTTPDANITVEDGSGPVALPAPSAVAGTTLWKTYYVANLTGDVTVNSTGPIAVGFIGFSGARGIAGYFSGFDTVPEVDLQVTGGGCLPTAEVEVVDPNFDNYQWFENGVLIAGADSARYTPTQAGDYYVRVTKGGCTYDSQPLTAYYCDPDVVIKKVADKNTVSDGETVTFTITVESFGINSISNLVLTDILPDGISLVSSSVSKGSFTYPNWSVGGMNSGELETLTLVTRITLPDVNTSTATYINNISNSQDQTDTNITTDDPSETVTVNFNTPTTVITNRRITIRATSF